MIVNATKDTIQQCDQSEKGNQHGSNIQGEMKAVDCAPGNRSENIFIFGLTADDVKRRRADYNPWDIYNSDEEIRRAIEFIERDFFNLTEPGIFRPLVHTLLSGGDRFMLLADLRDYIHAQETVNSAYKDHEGWIRKSIINVARAGKFSSDRTIREYASQIWHVEPGNGS